MRATSFALVLLLLGCEKNQPPPAPLPAIPIRLGDCAPASVDWISGPRPLAFTPEQAEGHWPDPEFAEPVVVDDPPPAAAPPKVAFLTDKNRKQLDRLLDQSLTANFGKFGSLNGSGTLGGTGVGFGTGFGARAEQPFGDLVTGAPALASGSLAGGAWFGAGSEVVSVWGGAGNWTAKHPSLYRPRHAGLQNPASYTPGATNPLGQQLTAISDCLHHGAPAFGAFVVELVFDPSGAVASAKAIGLDGEPANACVAGVAKKVKRNASPPSSERCSLAFGTQPVAALRTISIQGEAVALDGKPVDDAALGKALAGHVALAETPRPVQTFGVLALAPSNDAKMSAVYRIAKLVLLAGDDFAFVRHAKLLLPLALPVAPVPVGTGGRWNRMTGARPQFSTKKELHPQTWIRFSAGKLELGIGASGKDAGGTSYETFATLDQLGARLKALKTSDYLAGRTDLAIATADDITYGQFLAVVDAAIAAGFTDWQLATIAELPVE